MNVMRAVMMMVMIDGDDGGDCDADDGDDCGDGDGENVCANMSVSDCGVWIDN